MRNMNIGDFSIAIRTLGKAGEKYHKLLKSIQESRTQPQKIVVVLPEGYDAPTERIGNEEFVYSCKSMILQRIEALNHINTKYTLFLDDDIEFDQDFIEKLLEPLDNNLFDCSTGPLFSFFPNSLAGRVAGSVTASVALSFFNRNKYVHILRSGGWSYHKFDTKQHTYLPTDSFAWTCFMIRSDVMRNLHMEDEYIWLERFGYAAGDDRVMAYKLIKNGYKACIVTDALYIHNDARTSTSKTEISSPGKAKFCMYYMHTVFWHRFIHDLEKSKTGRIINHIWFLYWKTTMLIYVMLKSRLEKDISIFNAFVQGVREGERYAKSDAYRRLPKVIDS